MHEDATFELELRLATLVRELFGCELILWFAKVDILATKQDRLKQVNVVLRGQSVVDK